MLVRVHSSRSGKKPRPNSLLPPSFSGVASLERSPIVEGFGLLVTDTNIPSPLQASGVRYGDVRSWANSCRRFPLLGHGLLMRVSTTAVVKFFQVWMQVVSTFRGEPVLL